MKYPSALKQSGCRMILNGTQPLEHFLETTLVIGDTHAPFMHPDAVPFLSAVKKKYKPGRIIHIGDVVDMHGLSRFTKDPQGDVTEKELAKARVCLQPLYELFPKAFVCYGNHDRRLEDRAAEAGIPRSCLMKVNQVIKGPKGWLWEPTWEFDGIVFEHGDGFSGEKAHIKAAHANMMNTVIGHTHAHAGIGYVGNRKHLIWGFNVGCLIDHKQYAFSYASRTPAKPIICCGVISDGIPMVVPMLLKEGGRWVGNL